MEEAGFVHSHLVYGLYWEKEGFCSPLRMSLLNKEASAMAANKPRGVSGSPQRQPLCLPCCCVNSGDCRKRWICTAVVSEEGLIAMELSLSETPDLNPITAAVCVHALARPPRRHGCCCWPLCPHESDATPPAHPFLLLSVSNR